MLTPAEILGVIGAGEKAVAKLSEDDVKQVRAFLRAMGLVSSSGPTDYADAIPLIKEAKVSDALKTLSTAIVAYYKKRADENTHVKIQIDRDGLKVCHLTPMYNPSKDKVGKDGKPLPEPTKLRLEEPVIAL
jgi:hypothetical protein